MSSFNNSSRGPDDQNRFTGSRRSSSSWLAAAVAAIIIILGLGYMFKDRWMGTSGVAEHSAATTVEPPASQRTVNPAPTPTTAPAAPAAKPKL